jgi:hypothetical protein
MLVYIGKLTRVTIHEQKIPWLTPRIMLGSVWFWDKGLTERLKGLFIKSYSGKNIIFNLLCTQLEKESSNTNH